MRRRVMVIEDNAHSRKTMCKILESVGKDIDIFETDNIHDAYRIALDEHIHLFIVDIILNSENSGDISGLRFVQEIRKIKKYEFIPVIFVTSLEDPKLLSYSQLNCLGYIEKPFDYNQVRQCVLKALNFPVVEDEERYIYFRTNGIVFSKRINEICFIDIYRRKLQVHCVNDNLTVPYKTCAQILKEIDSPLFVQCSRYCIVNRKYIEHIDYARRFIKMKNNDELIEIGSGMKSRFKREIENGYYCC